MTDSKLSWNEHVEYVCGKTSKRIYFLVLWKRTDRPPSDIIDTYKAIIRSVLGWVCMHCVALTLNKTTIRSD